MMKRIALATVCLLAAVGLGYALYPDEFTRYAEQAAAGLPRLWEKVEANPFPVGLALGTFLLTALYHKAKGKSFRESVTCAATRVTVGPVAKDEDEPETPVLKRAKARAVRAQLLSDRIGLENRFRKLPEEVVKAEKVTCYTEQAVADAKKALEEKQKAHDRAVSMLATLRKEKSAADAELAEIDVQLKKLAAV